MENERKIFKAWLYKYVKIDKIMTGRKLAGKIGVDPTTISSYVRGRTNPDLETREAILRETNTPHAVMYTVGQKELKISTPPPPIVKGFEKKADMEFKLEMSERLNRSLESENTLLKEKIARLEGRLSDKISGEANFKRIAGGG